MISYLFAFNLGVGKTNFDWYYRVLHLAFLYIVGSIVVWHVIVGGTIRNTRFLNQTSNNIQVQTLYFMFKRRTIYPFLFIIIDFTRIYLLYQGYLKLKQH